MATSASATMVGSALEWDVHKWWQPNSQEFCPNQSSAVKMLRPSLNVCSSRKRMTCAIKVLIPTLDRRLSPSKSLSLDKSAHLHWLPHSHHTWFWGFWFFILANTENTNQGICWICYLLILELHCSHKISAFSIFGGPSWALSSGDAEYFPEKNIFGEIQVFCYPKWAVYYSQIKMLCSGWVGGEKGRNGKRI